MVLLLGWLAWRIAGRSQGRGFTAERLVAIAFAALAIEVGAVLAAHLGWLAAAAWARVSAVVVSSAALVFFTRKVFRPDRAWATAFAWILTLLVGASFTLPLALGLESRGAAVLWGALRSTAYLWAFCECLAYWRVMRRRVGLGLADAVVANRFFLWSVWTGSAACLPLVGVVTRIAYWLVGREDALLGAGQGAPGTAPIWVSAVAMVALLGVVVALWLSFVPPRSYERWLRARTPDATPA